MKCPSICRLALCGLVPVLSFGCTIGVRRDLSAVKPQEVIFDDMCGLQSYFDALDGGKLKSPALVSGSDLSQGDKSAMGGRHTYAFETDFQKKELRRVLHENWKALPEPLETADKILVDVRWSQKAGVARVVTDADATLSAGGKSWDIEYQHCLSDLLFGAPLYKTRRAMLMPPAPPPIPAANRAPAAVAVVSTPFETEAPQPVSSQENPEENSPVTPASGAPSASYK